MKSCKKKQPPGGGRKGGMDAAFVKNQELLRSSTFASLTNALHK